jgi:hypothetical protein
MYRIKLLILNLEKPKRNRLTVIDYLALGSSPSSPSAVPGPVFSALFSIFMSLMRVLSQSLSDTLVLSRLRVLLPFLMLYIWFSAPMASASACKKLSSDSVWYALFSVLTLESRSSIFKFIVIFSS